MVSQALYPESAPVVANNLVQRIHHVVEGIGLQCGAGARRSVKKATEVVNRLLGFALLPNYDVGPQPVQSVLVIEVCAPAPRVPRFRGEVKLGRSVGCVLQVTPLAAGKMIEGGCGERQVVPVLLDAEQATARR